MPIVPIEKMPNYKIIAKVLPSKEEIENNPRSRSATLRVIERIKWGIKNEKETRQKSQTNKTRKIII